MYHSIGIKGGYGYYPMYQFQQDIGYIAENDIWCGNTDAVVLYIMEKDKIEWSIEELQDDGNIKKFYITFSDGLENAIYDQELTINFSIEDDYNFCMVESQIDSVMTINIIDKKFTLNIIPNEKKYLFSFIKE